MGEDQRTALARLNATARNVQQAKVVRSVGIVSDPMRVRHVINQVSLGSMHPYFAGQIYSMIQHQGLRISRGGQQAQFSDGAYVWPEGKDVGSKQYIDIELPAGVALEMITTTDERGTQSQFFRVMPHESDGDYIKDSKIAGTNIDQDAIETYRKISNDRNTGLQLDQPAAPPSGGSKKEE